MPTPVSAVRPAAPTPAIPAGSGSVVVKPAVPAGSGSAVVKPAVARRAPAPKAPATAADALAAGQGASGPRAFETALIRLTGEAVDRFQRLERARQRFSVGELPANELHAAEKAMEEAYGRLRTLHDSVGPLQKLSWRLRAGFDLDTVWRQHGLPLPPAYRAAGGHDLAWGIASGISLAVTTGALGALFLIPSPATFVVAGPIALGSGLLGGALVMIKGNGMIHAGDAGPDRVPARAWLDARGDHYAGASPEAYKTALIHLSTRARMAQENLEATKALAGKGQASDDHVRIARLELHAAYRDLHALAGAVGEVKAAAWQAQGFDVDAAWKTWGLTLPPLASLDRAPVVPPLDHVVRRPAQWMGGLITTVAGAIAADLFNAGRIGGLAARGLAAIYRVHPLFAIVVAGGAGFLAGGLLVDGLNKLLGPRSPAKAPQD